MPEVALSPLAGFAPVVDEHCRVLVLGSFPGTASLRAGHYYAHPSNRFWPILSVALGEDLTVMAFPERYRRLRAQHIGLWDVIASCRRQGSLDASIRDARPAGLSSLAADLPVLAHVLTNGSTASRLARQADWPAGVRLQAMPSTSAAYASMPADEKCRLWVTAVRQGLGIGAWCKGGRGGSHRSSAKDIEA
ncbi:MAG: DNA-deoxyinosine glycosylase [Burkholderiaceae bacterium]